MGTKHEERQVDLWSPLVSQLAVHRLFLNGISRLTYSFLPDHCNSLAYKLSLCESTQIWFFLNKMYQIHFMLFLSYCLWFLILGLHLFTSILLISMRSFFQWIRQSWTSSGFVRHSNSHHLDITRHDHLVGTEHYRCPRLSRTDIRFWEPHSTRFSP